jgi:thymidylate synthase
MLQLSVSDIRKYFIEELQNENFTVDRSGQKTIELIGASFFADENAIFGKPSVDYINAELNWYLSGSTNINDIYPFGLVKDSTTVVNRDPPTAWQYAANDHGEINSNYGHLIFGDKYHNQYGLVLDELLHNSDSRRASMVYTRPSIWMEYNENGKNDFICTNSVTYYLRDGTIDAVVQMRSNDVVFGYKNDYAWQRYVLEKLVDDYNHFYLSEAADADYRKEMEVGNIIWQVQNLHVYERHFHLVK